MNLLFPITFILSFLCPGILELYAAYKLFPFLKYRGGLVVFIFLALSAQFDLLYSTLIIVYIWLNGGVVERTANTVWTGPIATILTIYLVISLFLWRFASGSIALWFTGKLTERPIRRFLGVPEVDSQ